MRAIDRAAGARLPPLGLMENAGRAVAKVIVERFAPRPTAVLCGPGDNGGDGWIVARELKARGWPVWVEALVERSALKGDAARAAATWDGETHPLGARTSAAELFVDALFGAGLSRALSGEAAHAAAFMAQTPERVIAIDVPSGVDGDTGAPVGDVCARAALTVAFVRKKAAHVLMPGRVLCGEIIVADIGASDADVAAQAVMLHENGPAFWGNAFPWPKIEAHKHARGHAIIASGGHGRSGAARLAARAALRVGAGLVTVLSPPTAMDENAAQLTAIMLKEASNMGAYAQAARDAQAMVIGPAFGTEVHHKRSLEDAYSATDRCPIVFDADAITLLSPLTMRLRASDVMTPHVGEFERAFGDNLFAHSKTRIEATLAAAQHAGCVMLLKGADTVIAAPDGRACVNTSGTPFLATAGSGDVLAGLISGLIAQAMPSFEAACAGAWLHGRVAEVCGPGLIAEDLPEALPRVLNALAPAALQKRP